MPVFGMDSNRMRIERLGWSSFLLALGISALWGGNFVALKTALATIPPIWMAFWRMLLGSVVVALWAWSRGTRLTPAAGEWGPLAALGFMFTVQIALLNIGIDLTSPAYSVILLNSHPIFANTISHFFVPGDQLNRRRVTGLLIAFAGICLVFFGRPAAGLAEHPVAGNLIVTVSAVLLAVRIVYTKQVVQHVEPVLAVVWQMLLSLPAFLLVAAFTEPLVKQPFNWEAAGALFYQGVVIAGFCYVTWTRLLRRHSPGVLSTFGFTTPVFGVALSAWAFAETITPRLLAGMAAVAAGILIVTRQPDLKTGEPIGSAARGALP